MDDRRRTLAAVTIVVGFLVLVIVIIGAIVSAKKVVSPIPEDNAIKIIFVTPTAPPVSSPSGEPKGVLSSPKPTRKASPTPSTNQ